MGASGVLHGHQSRRPEKAWRALDCGARGRVYRVNAVGPALVAMHFLPLLAFWTGARWQDWAVCVALYWLRMFGVTGAYHRYFAHRTDEGLGPWVAPGPAFETPAGKRRIRDLVRGARPFYSPLVLRA